MQTTPRPGTACVPRRPRALLLALLLPLLLLSRGALAAPVGDLLGGGSPSKAKVVQAEDIRRRAVRTFERSAERLSRQILDDDALGGEEHQTRLTHVKGDFGRHVEEKLNELSGDGVLTLDEVQSSLGDVRQEHIARLEENLRALNDNAPPPPHRQPRESWLHFTGRQAHYTFLVRNHPLRFLWFGLSILVGIAIAGLASLMTRARTQDDNDHRPWARVASRLHGPAYSSALVAGTGVGLSWIWMPTELATLARKAVLLGLGLVVTWILFRLTHVLLWRLERREVDSHAHDLATTALRTCWAVLFVVYVVEVILGTDFTALLAGIGIVGVGLTLAAQDGLKNLFGAGTIHADGLFRVGQLVRFDDYLGNIEHIGFRSIRLRLLDGHAVIVPNSKVTSQAVENLADRPYIRRLFDLSLPYDTPREGMQRAVEIVREVVSSSDYVREDPAPHVAFHEFAAYSLDVMVMFYHATSDWWEAKERDTELNLEIMKRFEAEGLAFAFPTQTLHVQGNALRRHVDDREIDLDDAPAGARGSEGANGKGHSSRTIREVAEARPAVSPRSTP